MLREACDVVGFHVKDYCSNFLKCCHYRLGCEVDQRTMQAFPAHRTVHIMEHPIGIPFNRFARLAKKAPALLKDTGKVKVILGVDRLDYTKGVNSYITISSILRLVLIHFGILIISNETG